jgi:hypothetical protein
VVLLSHDQHGDNLDDAGRVVLATTPTVITTKVGARWLGGGARGLDPWEVTRLDSAGKPTLEITATPCRHGPPLSRPIVGQVIGFALRWDGQRNGVSCESQATPCSTTVSARLPIDSTSTSRSFTWVRCSSRSPGRFVAR